MSLTRIGLLFPLSGEWAWVGRPCLAAAEAALDLARQSGILGGSEVELLPGDAPDPARAVEEAERLIDAGADILFGTMFSSQALPASEVAARRGIPYWEAVAASDLLTARGHRGVFRVDTNAAAYGSAVADLVADQLAPAWGARPQDVGLAIVHLEEPFCTSVGDALEAAAVLRGLRVAHRARLRSRSDVEATVEEVRGTAPDVVFMSAFGPSVTEFARLARRRIQPKAIVGNGAWALAHRVGELGDDIDGVFSVDTPHVSSLDPGGLLPAARDRLAWWRERCGEPHSIKTPVDRDLVFLSAGILFEDVLPHARSNDLEDVRAAAAAVDLPLGATILGYGARFDQRGENTRAFAALLQWQDGVRHTVHPKMLATAEARTSPLPAIS